MTDLSATDVYKFDIEQARIKYLRAKRARGQEVLPTINVPAKARALFDDELPCFLRPQAE